LFGIPVEENVTAPLRFPWVTSAVFLLMALATAWAGWLNPDAIASWGLLPAEPFRHGGLTFVTSFFLHAGLLHFLGNAAFLVIFGDNVEDSLGHIRFALLLIGSSLAGDLLHMTLDPRGTIPSVGASAGISGVIVFYACQFPQARLVHLFRFGLIFRWVRFSALTGLIFWIALQALGAWQQLAGLTNISALSHLGGGAFGFLWWLVARKNEQVRAQGS
jgi:membrane associated rhomboid family serine protease